MDGPSVPCSSSKIGSELPKEKEISRKTAVVFINDFDKFGASLARYCSQYTYPEVDEDLDKDVDQHIEIEGTQVAFIRRDTATESAHVLSQYQEIGYYYMVKFTRRDLFHFRQCLAVWDKVVDEFKAVLKLSKKEGIEPVFHMFCIWGDPTECTVLEETINYFVEDYDESNNVYITYFSPNGAEKFHNFNEYDGLYTAWHVLCCELTEAEIEFDSPRTYVTWNNEYSKTFCDGWKNAPSTSNGNSKFMNHNDLSALKFLLKRRMEATDNEDKTIKLMTCVELERMLRGTRYFEPKSNPVLNLKTKKEENNEENEEFNAEASFKQIVQRNENQDGNSDEPVINGDVSVKAVFALPVEGNVEEVVHNGQSGLEKENKENEEAGNYQSRLERKNAEEEIGQSESEVKNEDRQSGLKVNSGNGQFGLGKQKKYANGQPGPSRLIAKPANGQPSGPNPTSKRRQSGLGKENEENGEGENGQTGLGAANGDDEAGPDLQNEQERAGLEEENGVDQSGVEAKLAEDQSGLEDNNGLEAEDKEEPQSGTSKPTIEDLFNYNPSKSNASNGSAEPETGNKQPLSAQVLDPSSVASSSASSNSSSNPANPPLGTENNTGGHDVEASASFTAPKANRQSSNRRRRRIDVKPNHLIQKTVVEEPADPTNAEED